MADFKVVSDFQPTGDQPEAIRQLVEGVERGDRHQTLLGVTGSGKTLNAPVFAISTATFLGIVAIISVRDKIIGIAMMLGKRAVMRARFLMSVSSTIL